MALSAHHSLAFYNPAIPTTLHVDASRLNGLGFPLKQKRTDAQWKFVQAESRHPVIHRISVRDDWAPKVQGWNTLQTNHVLTV